MRQRLFLLALAVAVLAVAGCSDGGGSTRTTFVTDPPEASITVNGTGEVSGNPDTLSVTIGVRVTRKTVAEATRSAASSASAVIDALLEAGVENDDIQTTGLSITPEYDFRDDGRQLLGFSVANSVVAKIREIVEAGEIIDAAVEAGGDDIIVGGVGFSLEDDAARLDSARARAWDNAERKAEQLAELAGVELGAATRVVEGFEGQPSGASFAQAAFDGASTPIQPGQVVSTVRLTVVFELLQ
jgi:uncharacterized protein